MINFHEAKEIAARYGADRPSFGPHLPRAEVWIEKIARLPLLNDDELAGAIVEANRCAGALKNYAEGLHIDARWPVRCQGCVPYINCLFICHDEEDEIDTCPRGAKDIAMDVMDTACLLRRRKVNLNDRAAVKACVLVEREINFIAPAIEGGRLDDLINRAVECARTG
jgi:hypothetical protein